MRKNNDEQQLRDAKRAYKEAKEVGNRAEEARWANYIGNIHKNRGEYVQALKWLRIDYDVSSNFLPDKQLLPTCNTLGELYLRLQDFKDALKIQKKHLQLAEDTNDLIEQQRASTQLGRTYHEMFMKSDDDHSSIKNAKKYFKSAMKLAKNLMKNPSSCKSTFVAEYVDAHNNIGMLEIDLDNLEEAQTILSRGLEICDEEELSENHDGRSRLHHNLGIVYMELRKWDKAREHMDEDISICNRIGHCQGEAKGYINLGELHYRVQKYDEAINCYHMALQRAESMEDEDVLVSQIEQNIKTVKAAINVMDEIKKEEQNLKRLARNMQLARGTAGERKCLLQQIASLDRLIEKSSMIFAWMKHLEYAKKRKKIANEICDKEKMGDSFLLIGESYQKLRKFKKALKWYTKSWETYNLIGNLEGQALSKIDIGNALDSNGNWMEAFKAFEEGYRIAVEANMPSAQLSALENMHYSQMIRFDDVDKARSLKSLIDKLKHLTPKETQGQDMANDCSETETEIDDLSLNPPEVRISPERSISNASRSKSLSANDLSENAPLISFLRNGKSAKKLRAVHDATVETAVKLPESSPRKASIASGSQAVGRKRIRLVLSDDESENDGEHTSRRTAYNFHAKEVATSNGCKSKSNLKSPVHELQVSKYFCSNSYQAFSLSNYGAAEGWSGMLVLPSEKRAKGLVPDVQDLKRDGKVLETLEAVDELKNHTFGNNIFEVSLGVWVPKPVMKLYVDCCKELSEQPDLKVLKKLYNLEVSEDEVIVSDCGLQDISVAPLLNALHAHKTVAVIDLSHNLLGNGTMERLKQVFTSSGQDYGALVLDLHCNLLGPTALFQICECPVLYNRLEVLNISGNRLTDACASYLSTILKKCKALYTLNIEKCSITSRTIQKIADSLDSGSVLAHLSLGHNNPISGNVIINLFVKICSLNRFQELNLTGIKLSKPVVDSLCQLATNSCLSGLILGGSSIGTDGALQLTKSLANETQELVKLDLSSCGLTCDYIIRLNIEVSLIYGILELNLGGNPLMQECEDINVAVLDPVAEGFELVPGAIPDCSQQLRRS
ncbi:protein TONSOKU-like [Coffea eugenioides]|uniref:protein TONSOKU-like n=1 Tax=Coffea eugenioides TaxID=49369 RepID=UPI000F609450|nr:protein TONSOKU-like [Coffea eugenioides]